MSESPTDLRAEYDRQYREWAARMGPQVHDLRWRLDHLLWRHHELLRRYPPAGLDVLDHGCMDGIFSIAMQQRGARVRGFDVAPAAIEQARRFGAEAFPSGNGPLFSTDAPPERAFDLVVSCEVIEHVPDDRAFAGELARFVKPGGRVIGTTPVGRSFWDPDHKRLYDEPMLRRALEPWGEVRIARYYRSKVRNWVPWPTAGASVFIFEIRP